ncbi:MAG TPA: spore coat protein [Bacillus sp. (in: firmicutes)]|uniref:spore coat protein n=1 Tax=Bacillus litorisediminis TaxID=2922713 RepID=UPI001FABCF6A|nr:spore coat protein [Bacillus litorisediminis]HWO74429.1 spore coat protein [Bacillus sp. (in: firmicutes)]
MLQDKDIVSDYLAGLNASLTGYASYISESNNPQLRQVLIQLRNQDEARQRELYEFALQKGYYQPSAPASQEVVQQLKSQLMSGQ